MQPLSPKGNFLPQAPKPGRLVKPKSIIEIISVKNHLPTSCVIEIKCPPGIDFVYYALLDANGKRLFYKSAYPCTVLPAFNRSEIETDDQEVKFVCWPVKKQVVGSPSYFGPIPLKAKLRLGSYPLEVDFKGRDQEHFEIIQPVLQKHYGGAALPGKVKVEEDRFDIYLPALDTIRLSADRRNLVHELVHASRKQMLFAMKQGKYSETTEMIEEFFAEGVANMVKDEINQEENDLLPTGQVYGSTHGYNYDFRIKDEALITENLQSTAGGILVLENARYYLASEAFHKVALEYNMTTGKHFGAEFNKRYYRRLTRTNEDPSKEMFYTICKSMMKSIEGLSTRKWLDQQMIFNCRYEPGEKIFLDIDDYHMHDEWLGICMLYNYETFPNGSDWAHGKRRYSRNGRALQIELKHIDSGETYFSQKCKISDYPNGFGQVKLYFHHKPDSPGVAHFVPQDQAANIQPLVVQVRSGLHEIRISSKNKTKVYYRILGEAMHLHRNQLMFARLDREKTAAIKLRHLDRNRQERSTRMQKFKGSLAVVETDWVQQDNCCPGILQVAYRKGETVRLLQRNIGYGGRHGGMQFLLH